MNKIVNQYRQGDVMLVPVQAIPASAKPAKVKRTVVLAEGEASGHQHSIDFTPKQMQVFTETSAEGQVMYLRVKNPVVLKHQEHAPATLEPGEYQVRRQVEFWLDEVRLVAD